MDYSGTLMGVGVMLRQWLTTYVEGVKVINVFSAKPDPGNVVLLTRTSTEITPAKSAAVLSSPVFAVGCYSNSYTGALELSCDVIAALTKLQGQTVDGIEVGAVTVTDITEAAADNKYCVEATVRFRVATPRRGR